MSKISYKFYLPCLIAAVMAMAACGCIVTDNLMKLGSKDAPVGDSVTESTDAKARVQTWWQDYMAKELAKAAEAKEAFGLFSEGGFTSAGQLMVIAGADNSGATLLNAVASARPRDPTRKDLSADAVQEFRKKLDGLMDLPDINEAMFDGIVYEFVHAAKAEDGGISVDKRVYIRRTGATEHPDHDRLIAAFNDLRRLR